MAILAIGLVLAALAYRLLAAHNPDMANFSPMMALVLCSAIYLKRLLAYLVPFGALLLSDLYLNRFYGGEPFQWGMLARYACFGLAFAAGLQLAKSRSWTKLFGVTLAGSILFYLVTNSYSWAADPLYAKTAGGWWQALTVGHPQYAPTWTFFRHTLVSDLLYMGVFAAAMEWALLREGLPSLLRSGRAAAGRNTAA